MSRERVKVLYISGWGRSGSTILGNILGQAEGYCPVGEIRFIWTRNLLENRLCGCSLPFLECDIWGRIFEVAFGGFDKVDANRIAYLCEHFTRTRQVPKMLLAPNKMKSDPKMIEYMNHLDKLYQAIRTVTGCRVIVDSSKYPSYASILELLPDVDLYVVHLVRDSRAVSFSWSKKKRQPDSTIDDYMIRFSPLKSSMIWNSWNLLTELFWRKKQEKYLLLRYEDFISDPRTAIQRIMHLVKEEDETLFAGDGGKISLLPNHTLSGNPIRFQEGALTLKLDDEWRTKMKPSSNLVTTVLTWPLLLKYQYLP